MAPKSNVVPVVVLLACVAIGIALGWGVGAVRYQVGEFEPVITGDMTQQPLGSADKVFNWLLFTIFAAAGVVAASVARLTEVCRHA